VEKDKQVGPQGGGEGPRYKGKRRDALIGGETSGSFPREEKKTHLLDGKEGSLETYKSTKKKKKGRAQTYGRNKRENRAVRTRHSREKRKKEVCRSEEKREEKKKPAPRLSAQRGGRAEPRGKKGKG